MTAFPKLSVVIPVYNEASGLSRSLNQVFSYLARQNFEFEVIAVEDCSTDNSLAVLERLALSYPKLKVMAHEPNRGKGYSVKEGVLAAKGEYVLFTDADQSTPLNQLEKFWPETGDTDVLISSRYVSGSKIAVKQPLARWFFGRVANLLIRAVILPGIHDTQNGFKLFTQRAAKIIFPRLTINRWGFDMEVLKIARIHRLKIKEIGVAWSDVRKSDVKLRRDAWSTLRELWRIRLNAWRGRYR